MGNELFVEKNRLFLLILNKKLTILSTKKVLA
jgi:hypothetical protein